MSAPSPSGTATFPAGDSETARMVRAYDWAETPIGPVETWQPGLCAVTTMMLSSSVPMAVLWGRDGILLYNDAYIAIAGNRHPELFGRPIQQAWPEVAEFNAYVLTTVLTGKSLSYRDMEMALARNRDADRLWVNLDFSPLLDDNGVPAGVLAIVTDTTDRVLAEREIAAQRDRLRIMFDQAPGFIAMMEGPEHVFTLVNQAYNRLMGSRNAVGRTVRDAVPEAIAHGLLRELDAAYVSGKPFVANDFKFAIADARGRIEDHYLDFVYQPIRDADGQICGIFAQGSDVTERVLATEALHRSRQEYRKLNDALIMANDILSSVPQAKPGSGD